MILNWLSELKNFITTNSFGLASIRVLDFNNITFGIIDPYGYYLFNFDSELYLFRDSNVAIKFKVIKDSVVTSLIQTSTISIGYIDNLFNNPPQSSSKLVKFVLFYDKMPQKYTAIELINRCLDLCIFHI